MSTLSDDGFVDNLINPIPITDPPIIIPGPTTTVPAPTNLQASAVAGKVTLTWQDNSFNEDGFRIRRRGPTDADFIEIAEVPANVTTYADNTVQPQTTYTYRVRSFRAGGGGGVSNDAIVTTPGNQQPTTVAAPTNLQASASTGKVTLTWQDNSNNEDGFRIRRRGPNDVDFVDIAEVGPNITTYADNTVQPQTTYTYRVRSFKAGGGGGVSNDATVTTPGVQEPTVAAPTNLQASAITGKVTLTWQDNSNNEDGFRVRRRGPSDFDFIDIAEVGPNVTTYADNTVQPQTTYTYRVRSFRAGGGGGVSNDATVTTPANQQPTVAAPTNLQASAATGKVTLTWQDNSNNEDGFRIRRRGLNDVDFIDIADVPPNVTTYTDNSVQPQTTYTYRVRSFRSGGGGGVSNDAIVTTPGTSQRRELSSPGRGSNSVVAGGRISIPVGQFKLTVNGIPTLEFVNAFAMLVPPDPTATLSISPANPIETFTDVTVTLDTKRETPPRAYNIVIGGQSTDVPGPAGAYPTQTIPVEVLPPPPMVTLSVDPASKIIRVGDSTTYDITLDRDSAKDIAIPLEIKDKTNGVDVTFDPPAPTGRTAKMIVTTNRNLVPVNLESVDLRIRSRVDNVKVVATTARLRFKPEAFFTPDPAMATVKRGDTQTFRFIANRLYYNDKLKLNLTTRGKAPSFTQMLRPSGQDLAFEYFADIKINDSTEPGTYTFVATPQFPNMVQNGIVTETTVELKVEGDTVKPVIVKVSEQDLKIKPGDEETVNLGIDAMDFVAPVTIDLETGQLPFGVSVDKTRIRLDRGGPTGVQFFTIMTEENASGSGQLTFRGTVDGMPNLPVNFAPQAVNVSILGAGSVILSLIGSSPVEIGEPALYILNAESFGYTGEVDAFITNAPGPVTFTTDHRMMVTPGKTSMIKFTIDTTDLQPMLYMFGVGATAIPPAPITDTLPARLTVDPKDDRTTQPPTIGGFTPMMGKAGDVVTISGTGFTANTTTVSLNDINLDIVSMNASELRVRIASNATSGKFTVQTPGGSVTSRDSFTIAPATPSLAAPPNLRATLAGSQVSLRWDDNSDEDGFRIERRAIAGAYQVIAIVPRGATSFADASGTPGAMVFYRVRAFAGAVESAPSNEIGVAIPLPQPTPSVGLSAAPQSQRVAPGGIAAFTIALARENYSGPVDLSITGLPFGAIATFSDDPVFGNSSILTIATSPSGPGLYNVTVRGTAPNVNVEATSLTVSVITTRVPPGGPIRPLPGTGGRDLRPGFARPDTNLDLDS